MVKYVGPLLRVIEDPESFYFFVSYQTKNFDKITRKIVSGDSF